MLKLLFDESENAALARFPNTEVAPRLLSDSAARASIVTGAVSLVRHRCGVLPQHLEPIYDVSDALDAPYTASTLLYDSVSRPFQIFSTDLSRSQLQSSSTTRWVYVLGRTSWMVDR